MADSKLVIADRLTTKQFADRWKTGRSTVAAWCKQGLISEVRKDGFRKSWSIPADAKRPLDRPLIRELIWQVVEQQNGRIEKIDLTEWGIELDDVPGYIQALIDDCCLRRRSDHSTVLCITQRGMQMIGRRSGADSAAPLSGPLVWVSVAGGSFIGAAIKQIVTP